MMSMGWRKMSEDDIEAVMQLAEQAFPNHYESRELFSERQSLFPEGCFVLGNHSGGIKGYCVSYPWKLGSIPELNRALGSIPAGFDTLFLHDLALHPDVRGMNYAKDVLDKLDESMRENDMISMTLVAVNNTVKFWTLNGFVVQKAPNLAQKLAGYGTDARYMIKTVKPDL